MFDEAARRQGHCAVWIKFGACSDPPRPGNNVDKPVVWVKVRMAHMMGVPFHQFDVQAWLFGIARQDRLALASLQIIFPFDLIWQLHLERRRIEIGGSSRSE